MNTNKINEALTVDYAWYELNQFNWRIKPIQQSNPTMSNGTNNSQTGIQRQNRSASRTTQNPVNKIRVCRPNKTKQSTRWEKISIYTFNKFTYLSSGHDTNSPRVDSMSCCRSDFLAEGTGPVLTPGSGRPASISYTWPGPAQPAYCFG